MAEKRMTCNRCPTWDREARRCRIGKANPRKKHETITLAEMLGPQALCIHNPWREPLLLRMHQPHCRFLWTDPALRFEPVPLEIEIIDEPENGDEPV